MASGETGRRESVLTGEVVWQNYHFRQRRCGDDITNIIRSLYDESITAVDELNFDYYQ